MYIIAFGRLQTFKVYMYCILKMMYCKKILKSKGCALVQ
jgi:hypothetical protein